MDKALKVLIGAACVCIIAATGWYFYSEQQERIRAQKLAEARKQAALEASLTPQKCMEMAAATIPEKAGQPPKTQEFIAALKQCDDLNRLPAYERHQLALMSVF